VPKRFSSPPRRPVSDKLWRLVEPLIRPCPPAVNGRTGRPRVENRAALEGILYVLTTGVTLRSLPPELGCGSAVTCWRRLRDWQQAGVWDGLHQQVLDALGEQGLLDWSRTVIDSVAARAKRGRADRPQPGRPGQARHEVPPAGRASSRAGWRR
jgi:transposase